MKKIIFTLALCAAGLSATAQGHEELLRFSQYDWSYGTARSAAMGGAFSSLGADLSVMSLNPAGLGMYRRSEISISPSFTSLRSTSLYRQDMPTGLQGIKSSMNRNRFALNNIGGAFNVYNGGGGVTSVTLGFAYNKLIDHNTHLNVYGLSGLSMADQFVEQLNGERIDPNRVGDHLDNGDYAGILGALLAVESGLVEYDDREGIYHLANTLAEGSYLDSKLNKQTRGSTGQFDISLGMNLGNTLYLGMSVGIQDIYYKEDADYNEIARDNPTDPGYLDNFSHITFLEQHASAVNVKFGAILRPVEALRIGLAFHTPTYINMEETYYADMYTRLYGYDQGTAFSSRFETPYELRTPMRLIGGLSYTFFDTAILSIDYERVWYNQMKMFWDGWDTEATDVTDQVRSIYKPADNLRAGLEVNVAPGWFVRGGFAYYGGMYRDQVLIDEGIFKQYDGHSMNYSGGFGYRTAGWGVDLAYIYMDRKDLPRYTYSKAAPYRLDQLRHNVTATLSFRF